MNDYLRPLLLAGCVSVLFSLLMPEKNERTRRVLSVGLSLFVLIMLVRPFFAPDLSSVVLPHPAPTGATYETADPDTRAALSAAAGEGVAADIAARYRLSPSDVRAEATLSVRDGELVFLSLRLTFSGAACTADLYAIRAFAAETYGCDCEVIRNG